MNKVISKLLLFNVWANDEIRNNLANVSSNNFGQDLGDLFVNDTNCTSPSLRSLVEHTLMGLNLLSSILEGKSFDGKKAIEQLREMSKDAVLKKWKEIDYTLPSLVESNLDNVVTIGERTINLSEDLVFTFLEHVIYHRGQINIALKILKENTMNPSYSSFVKQKLGKENY